MASNGGQYQVVSNLNQVFLRRVTCIARRNREHCKNLWWERNRAHGKTKYVEWCTCGWGSLIVVFTTSWDYFVESRFSYARLLIAILAYLTGGYFVGLVGWRENEWRYEKLLKNDAATRMGGLANAASEEA